MFNRIKTITAVELVGAAVMGMIVLYGIGVIVFFVGLTWAVLAIIRAGGGL